MQPKPNILAFDTSAAHCAAALLLGDRIVTRVDEMAKGQAEHLMPMMEAMLQDNELTWADLDGIGVGVGPGNFTGIRIAVSAARGLALGLANLRLASQRLKHRYTGWTWLSRLALGHRGPGFTFKASTVGQSQHQR